MRVAVGVLLLSTMARGAAAVQQTPAPTIQPPATVEPQAPASPPGGEPSNQEINDRYMDHWSQRIAGREGEPAARVFKNIQIEWFKTMPAGRLLRIMNGGYSRALGVRCTHCHLEEDFASDAQRPKRAAREMAVMHRLILKQLQEMENLEKKPEDRVINCSTCHRGRVDPMVGDR